MECMPFLPLTTRSGLQVPSLPPHALSLRAGHAVMALRRALSFTVRAHTSHFVQHHHSERCSSSLTAHSNRANQFIDLRALLKRRPFENSCQLFCARRHVFPSSSSPSSETFFCTMATERQLPERQNPLVAPSHTPQCTRESTRSRL